MCPSLPYLGIIYTASMSKKPHVSLRLRRRRRSETPLSSLKPFQTTHPGPAAKCPHPTSLQWAIPGAFCSRHHAHRPQICPAKAAETSNRAKPRPRGRVELLAALLKIKLKHSALHRSLPSPTHQKIEVIPQNRRPQVYATSPRSHYLRPSLQARTMGQPQRSALRHSAP